MKTSEIVKGLNLLADAIRTFATAIEEPVVAPPQVANYTPVEPVPAPAAPADPPTQSAPTSEPIPATIHPAAPTSAQVSAPNPPPASTSDPTPALPAGVTRQTVIDAFVELSRQRGDAAVIAVLKSAGYNRLSDAPESAYSGLWKAAVGAANG